MGILSRILLVFADVCFVMAAFWQPGPPRPVLGWLGLAFWVLSEILGRTVNH